MKRSFAESLNILLVAALGILSIGACFEFFNVAWGTGKAVGHFSLRWLILFVAFVLVCLALLIGAVLALLHNEKFESLLKRVVDLRNKLSFARWLAAIVVLVLPVWFLQYTMWGIVFHGAYFRYLLWTLTVLLISALITSGDELIGWKQCLASVILTSSAFTIAISLQGVNDYPFSLAWSEGNRLWDYSTLFGRARYDYPAGQDIYAYLDAGRLFVGGLPFLIPNAGIEFVRLWTGLLLIVPYFIVGFAAYIAAEKNIRVWFLLTLWVFLFLRQGPIHTPLVLAAALTVFLWRKPLWFAIPLIVYAGYYAQAGRFTWLFAPGIWIGMLELAGASLHDGKLDRTHWVRAITLGAFGVFGGFFLPKLIPFLNHPATSTVDVGEQIATSGVSSEFVASAVTNQPLLWYRLLPNSTYGTGILLGLLIAVLPTIILLVWLSATKKWQLNLWQILAVVGPLLAFLVVGLVASTKIGGGGDLHNLDMFLIGLAFTAFIAWMNGGKQVVMNGEMPAWVRLVLVASLIIPAITPLRQLRSFSYGDEMNILLVLTDTQDKKQIDMLPDSVTVNEALKEIQEAVTTEKSHGDVLFMDQRQLLTFGYIKDVPLIPEYEKKVLMDEALSSDADYFSSFYKDLAAHRFSLIVTEPLRTPVKDSSYEFGEENNAWVKWVSIPVLCYYEEIQTYKEVNVQLLVPKSVPEDCSAYLP